jgi:hypothetical protein
MRVWHVAGTSAHLAVAGHDEVISLFSSGFDARSSQSEPDFGEMSR